MKQVLFLFEAVLKLLRVGGWVGGWAGGWVLTIDNKANSVQLQLPTGTELGKIFYL